MPDFRDRRSIAAFAGPTPTPYSSGHLEHEQGISEAGNAIVRAPLVQLAWRWVRFQTGSVPVSRMWQWWVSRSSSVMYYIAQTNDDTRPFRWTKDPDKIITAVRRGHQVFRFNLRIPEQVGPAFRFDVGL